MKSKLQLNILWLDNKIGLAIDQFQSGERIPLTSYFFWPETDAWGQIKSELETKLWIKNSDKTELLYGIATIMNQWQSSKNKIPAPIKDDTT